MTWFILVSFVYLIGVVESTPLQPTFTSCLSSYTPVASGSSRLNVSAIYANLVSGYDALRQDLIGGGQAVLRVDLVGTTGQQLAGFDDTTGKLATLFSTTTTGGLSIYDSATYLCNSLFPSTLPTPYYPFNTTYCPLPAGDFAINLTIPLSKNFALITLHTQIRIVDTAIPANTLTCVDVHFTPYEGTGWYYRLFLWVLVALAVGYWITSWAARFAAGWVVGSGVAEYGQKESSAVKEDGASMGKREANMRKWGTMIVSGLSGERLGVSGGLLRFITPGLRDIIYHVQFCTILGMIAVSWPDFAYPIFAQGSWADLVHNTTLVQGTNPLSKRISVYPANYTSPTAFAKMMNDPYYPLYLDSGSFNPLLDLHSASDGLESFATAIGLRPQDLFGTCLAIFLLITAAVVLISIVLWFLHGLGEYMADRRNKGSQAAQSKRSSLGPSPNPSWLGKELYGVGGRENEADNNIPAQLRMQSSAPSRLRRTWWRFRMRGEAGAFHVSALYGNLLRLILMFHLPITTFSIYQLCLGSNASIVSRVFAGLAFVFISIVIPTGIMYKVYRTPTGKLYDATRTLLALGPIYNVYEQEKQMFRVLPLTASLITGIVVGAGQRNGFAQAIVILVIELALLIVPAIWFPWGEGASMGGPSTFLTIVRVASLVLVMLLSPTVAMTEPVADWLAYAVLILQAIAFLFFVFILISKIVEGVIRLVGDVHFDESTHPLDGGFFGAIMSLDCLNGARGGTAAQRRRKKRSSRQLQRNVSAAGSLTTQMMLDRHSQGVPRQEESRGTTPFLTGYPSHEIAAQGSYFAPIQAGHAYAPPFDRQTSDERSGEGPIMDAWQPVQPTGYGLVGPPVPSVSPTSATPTRGFSVIRGGRADLENPYALREGSSHAREPPPSVRISQGGQQRAIPTHSRQKSHSAVVEMFESGPSQPTTPLYPPSRTSPGLRPDNHGLLPPVLSIPKKRSLNNLRADKEDSPSSQYSDSLDKTKKGRRRSKPSGWFAKTERGGESSTEESDDEPGPSSHSHTEGGWRKALGLGRKKEVDDITERAKDENKARKAAVVAESGALFAGVENPTSASPGKKGFVVNRKGASPLQPVAGPSSQPLSMPESSIPTPSFKVKRPNQPITIAQPRPSSFSTPIAQSFTVKRVGQAIPTPVASPPPTSPPPSTATPIIMSTSPPPPLGPPVRSFKVIRPNRTNSSLTSPSSPGVTPTFVVNRPATHTPPSSAVATPQNDPKQRMDVNRPGRPQRNPNRSSQELERHA